MIVIARHYQFVQEYCKDFNGSAAYRRVYGEDVGGAGESAFNLLKKPEIQGAIEERKAELAAAAKLTPEWILNQWIAIAEADPNEIIDLRKVPCAACYAEGRGEMYKLLGFNLQRDPCPECHVCDGLGIERIVCKDTRKLTGSARRLYAGVKQTANGIEIKMHDQDAARHHLASYLGMLKSRTEISGPGGAPIRSETLSLDPKDLTDEQLAAIVLQRSASEG